MEKIKRYFLHHDDRGSIEGLIRTGKWQEINLITSIAETVRGNHYHKNTRELFIILEGEIEVIQQKVVNNKKTAEILKETVKTGDVFIIEPFFNHIFITKKDSKWLNALSHPLDLNNPDIIRIEND